MLAAGRGVINQHGVPGRQCRARRTRGHCASKFGVGVSKVLAAEWRAVAYGSTPFPRRWCSPNSGTRHGTGPRATRSKSSSPPAISPIPTKSQPPQFIGLGCSRHGQRRDLIIDGGTRSVGARRDRSHIRLVSQAFWSGEPVLLQRSSGRPQRLAVGGAGPVQRTEHDVRSAGVEIALQFPRPRHQPFRRPRVRRRSRRPRARSPSDTKGWSRRSSAAWPRSCGRISVVGQHHGTAATTRGWAARLRGPPWRSSAR